MQVIKEIIYIVLMISELSKLENELNFVLILKRKGNFNVKFIMDYYTKDESAVDGVKYIS